MSRFKITQEDIERIKAKRFKITRDDLCPPVRLQNISDGQQVFRPYLNIIAKGYPNWRYELKYINDTHTALADAEGKFHFDRIRLGGGRNCFTITNPDKRNIANQNLQFAVLFDTSRLIYIGRSDPITQKEFTTADDISTIVRCKKCYTFYYESTIADSGRRCSMCRHKQYYNHNDDEFYREKTIDKVI